MMMFVMARGEDRMIVPAPQAEPARPENRLDAPLPPRGRKATHATIRQTIVALVDPGVMMMERVTVRMKEKRLREEHHAR